jgi:L-fuconolactonase
VAVFLAEVLAAACLIAVREGLRRSKTMEIVDAQIHATHRGLVQSIAIMDAMGVSAAVLDDWPPTQHKLPSGVTRFEYPFAEEAVTRFPARFAFVVRFDPNDPDIDDLVGRVRKAPGRLCVRIASGHDFKVLREGGHERILAAASKHRVPVMIYCRPQELHDGHAAWSRSLYSW